MKKRGRPAKPAKPESLPPAAPVETPQEVCAFWGEQSVPGPGRCLVRDGQAAWAPQSDATKPTQRECRGCGERFELSSGTPCSIAIESLQVADNLAGAVAAMGQPMPKVLPDPAGEAVAVHTFACPEYHASGHKALMPERCFRRDGATACDTLGVCYGCESPFSMELAQPPAPEPTTIRVNLGKPGPATQALAGWCMEHSHIDEAEPACRLMRGMEDAGTIAGFRVVEEDGIRCVTAGGAKFVLPRDLAKVQAMSARELTGVDPKGTPEAHQNVTQIAKEAAARRAKGQTFDEAQAAKGK